MSVSRKNWSALSSLARQWTVEDEEEQKREHRRKTRDPSISADPDDDDGLSSDGNQDSRSVSSAPQDPSEQGEGNMQPAMDFVEMLRSRDERRRARHLETLRRQKQEEEDGGEEGGEAQPRVELLGDVEVEEAFLSPLCSLLARESTTSTASPASPTSPTSPASPASISTSHSRSHSSNSAVEGQNEDGKADSNQSSPRKTSRKFVSSFSISIDTSPASASPQRVVSPLSPRGPPERPFSPTFGGPQSPTLNGGAENGASSSFEPATRPAFIKQSSRTTSFRKLKKQEEEQSMPLQRSASVRVTSKIESNKTREEDQDEQQQSPFQRNSKQRISARAIQEKMERLAQAAQKQTNKSPFQAERTLFLMDEVVRKKNIFESEQPKGEKEPGMSRQEYRNFSSGIADRINRWVQKQTKSSPSSTSTDLRNVDIVSKKILFEQAKDDRPMSPVPHSKSPK